MRLTLVHQFLSAWTDICVIVNKGCNVDCILATFAIGNSHFYASGRIEDLPMPVLLEMPHPSMY